MGHCEVQCSNKMFGHVKEPENMTYNQDKKHSIGTDQENERNSGISRQDFEETIVNYIKKYE